MMFLTQACGQRKHVGSHKFSEFIVLLLFLVFECLLFQIIVFFCQHFKYNHSYLYHKCEHGLWAEVSAEASQVRALAKQFLAV
jgi:hypothetical protein